MKKHAKILALLLSATLLLGCFAACGGGESAKSNKAEVSICLNTETDSMDPSRCGDGATGQIVYEINEGPFRYDEKGTLQCAGFESYEVSEDGLTYTFHVRDNKYNDGTPVTAADFVNGLHRSLDPMLGSHNAGMFYVIEGAEAYNTDTGSKEDVAYKAIDDKTIEMKLSQPVPYFTQMMVLSNFAPVPVELTEGDANSTYGSDIAKMKFSGPFYLTKWQRGSGFTLEKNPNYWDAASVKLDVVNVPLVQEENTRQQMFENGDLNVLTGVKPEYRDKLMSDIEGGKFTMTEMEQPRYTYVCFNNNDPDGIFTNAKVRLAFSLAIDREEYIKNVARVGRPAYGMIPPAINNGEGKFRDAVEEPLKALAGTVDPKALLDEGLAEIGKKAEDVTVTFLAANGNQDTKVSAEYFQNTWQSKLGVTVKIDTAADNATFNSTVSKGMYQICNTGWGADYNDPMTFMMCYTTGDGNNPTFGSNARYDELVFDCVSEMDMDVRAEKFAEAEKICVAEDCYLAPFSYGFKQNLVSKDLKGVYFNGNGGAEIELKTAYLEEAAK